MLPRWSWLAEQFNARLSQFVHGRGQVADGETGYRAGIEMLFAWMAAAENLHMPPVRQLEDPEVRLRVHEPETEDMLVEMRQLTAPVGPGAAPSKARDFHICQFYRDRGRRASFRRAAF